MMGRLRVKPHRNHKHSFEWQLDAAARLAHRELRSHTPLPPSLEDVANIDECIAQCEQLPPVSCAFKGCTWLCDWSETIWNDAVNARESAWGEREVPTVGSANDRRTINHTLVYSARLHSVMPDPSMQNAYVCDRCKMAQTSHALGQPAKILVTRGEQVHKPVHNFQDHLRKVARSFQNRINCNCR